MTKKQTRLSLDFSDHHRALLERACELLGTKSRSEVLRRSISLLDAALEAKGNGLKVGAFNDQGELMMEFLLI